MKPEYDAGKNLKDQMDAAVALYEEDWESISCAHCQTMNAASLYYGSVQNGSSNAAGWTNISIKPTPSKIRRAK